MNDVSLGLYIERSGGLQRLHPTTKLVAMLTLFTAVFLSDRIAAIAPLTLAVALVAATAGATRNLWRLRLLLLMVFAMTFVLWSLFYPYGEPLVAWGPVRISAPGLDFATGTALKLTTFLCVGIVFLSVTKIEEFAYALQRVGIPYKLAFTITLTFRLVPVFLDSATSVVQAQRCRGLDFAGSGPIRRLRLYVPILVPVFIGALRRADGMAIALEARGFQRVGGRTSLAPYVASRADALAAIAVAGLAAGYGWLWFSGWTAR